MAQEYAAALNQAVTAHCHPTASTPPASQATGSIEFGTLGQLERLATLRDRGALTDTEFEAEKHKILGPVV
jgi:hypothetical protein